VSTSISVGIAHHEGAAPVPVLEDRRGGEARRRTHTPTTGSVAAAAHREATAQLLLRRADTAMYAAKGAGKSRAVLADVAAVRAGGAEPSSALPECG